MVIEASVQNLRNAVKGLELSEAEVRTIEWLCGWEDCTISNLACIIMKARLAGEQEAVNHG